MVVDASLWVSSLLPQDVHHVASRDWLGARMARGESLVVPTITLAEVAGAIARRSARPELGLRAAEAILRAPGVRLVPLDAALGLEASRAAADLQLRGADAVYVAVARSLNLALVTLDEELLAKAGRFVEVLRP